MSSCSRNFPTFQHHSNHAEKFRFSVWHWFEVLEHHLPYHTGWFERQVFEYCSVVLPTADCTLQTHSIAYSGLHTTDTFHEFVLFNFDFSSNINRYPTAFPYGNGMVLHFYQQQESSTTKTVHKIINKGLKTYVLSVHWWEFPLTLISVSSTCFEKLFYPSSGALDCVTACGVMQPPRCCRPSAGNIVGCALHHKL